MTGERTLISGFGDADQGPLGFGPIAVAIDNSGSILVIDPGSGQIPGGTLFRVDPATGQRTVVSDFTDPNQGPLSFAELSDVAVTSAGAILVLDASGGSENGLGALLSVDPATGQRTTVSDFWRSESRSFRIRPAWLGNL